MLLAFKLLSGNSNATAEAAAPPLWLAIRDGYSSIRFQHLLQSGADPLLSNGDGDTAMHLAAASSNSQYLRKLLAFGISPNTPNRQTERTPIFSSLMYERESQFTMLLASGASPGSVDRMGNTPLHLAALIGAFPRVLDLLKAGAPPEALNRQRQTFQRYLFMTPYSRLTASARQAIQEVVDWLQIHNIALDASYGAQ